MRKSAAPSFRKIDHPKANVSGPHNRSVHSTSTKCNENIAPIPPENVTNSNDPPSESKLVYNVVWGKRTTKKHKTFEDDGTLTISNKTATLRGSDGNHLGSSTIKPEEIEIGSRLTVGSNDIEIIEQATGVKLPKRKADDDEVQNSETKKKSKSNPSSFQPYMVLSHSAAKKPSARINFGLERQMDYEPLIMPEPTQEHQLKFNAANRSVKEVSVIPCCARQLRPHQREGVQFLYECLMGFRHIDHVGCILADEMGLGKTLQCISVCYTLLRQGPYGLSVANRILILAPSSLVENWDKEIKKWLGQLRAYTFQIDSKHKIHDFANAKHIPFLLISYEMFTKHFDELKTVHFDIMICDEGHRLKNQAVKVSTMLNQIDCARRVILTGTPIQNDLHEFFSLVSFVNPNILGTYDEYKRFYELPILASQQPHASEWVVELGEERAKQLNELTSSFILRRTQDVNQKYLPKKQEFVVFCKQSALQRDMIEASLELYNNNDDPANGLQIIMNLKKICNHPALINAGNQTDTVTEQIRNLVPSWDGMGPFDSGKLCVLHDLLHEMRKRQEKLVLISYHTKTLDILQGWLDHLDFTHCRLDGTTPSNARSAIVEDFNNPAKDLFVFLLSAKAGGVGLNLIGASRLVLFDNDWNPASDLQAMSRIWRDGQKKEVFIYRLILAGSIEEKIFQRQLSKVALTGCVVDQSSKKEKLKLSNEELKDLFSIQIAVDECATHELLDCQCNGDGLNVEQYKEMDLPATSDPTKSLQMHELSSWQHYKYPIDSGLLAEMCMPNVSEEIAFIFRNQNDT
ncbi:DNA repair and recombination protein RAD54B-like [Bradysia coprophila]|uniref:DNA repair and recombination protein RAD54B-like n=1 Tax=Bradysia coprophila TaxID=38358 RepID=UPI00187D76C4|nr:DNA repair and recombination protein RAD54B-like [Bradysia coprophila]